MKEIQAEKGLVKMLYKPFTDQVLKFEGTSLKHLHFKTIDSTQTIAAELLNHLSDKNSWGVVTADAMTKGQTANPKGKWISPIGNLYSSFCLKIHKSQFEKVQVLPQLCSLSVCEVIRAQSQSLSPQIKWINDTLINNRKVAGVLCQSLIGGSHLQLILGIGINVNTSKEHYKELQAPVSGSNYAYPATSLKIELGQEINERAFFLALCQTLIKNIKILMTEGTEPIISEVEKHLVNLEKEVIMTDYDGQELEKGVFLGLNGYGHARLMLQSGEEKDFHSGRMRLIQV